MNQKMAIGTVDPQNYGVHIAFKQMQENANIGEIERMATESAKMQQQMQLILVNLENALLHKLIKRMF